MHNDASDVISNAPRQFDPKLLLNPKSSSSSVATVKKMQDAAFSLHSTSSDPRDSALSLPLPDQSGRDDQKHEPKRFLEDLYGVEQRAGQPTKKIKVTDPSPSIGPAPKKPSFHYSSTGIIGDYMRMGSEDLNVTGRNLTVDLTNGKHFFSTYFRHNAILSC